MANNVQSIVCCLGDPVAGNPTQFLMQRAAASLGIDWMFVTAEVPTSKIEEAFQGIRALRFSGVAFLPPHQEIGCKLVDSMTEAATRSGRVRVARRDGDLWLGDDLLGVAIIELLKSQLGDLPQTIEQSNPISIIVSGQPYLSHLVRLAMPADQPHQLVELVDMKSTEVPAPRTSASDGEDTIESTATDLSSSMRIASIPTLSFEEALSSDSIVDALVIDSCAPSMSARQAAKIRWGKNSVVIFVEPNPKWEAAISSAKTDSPKILRTLDLAAAKAVVNFQFWTGHSIDLASIRESLDEYCQW